MFLDLITKPCSVVVSRIVPGTGGDLKMPVVEHKESTTPLSNKILKKKWIIDSSEDGSRLKIVRDVEVSKSRKVSPLTLYTQIEDGLVTDVCCKRFKKRHKKAATLGLKVNDSQQLRLNEHKLKDEVADEVRELMDSVLHQVTMSTMDAAEMTRLVRAFCLDHGFDDNDFADPLALLRSSNVLEDCLPDYGSPEVSKHKKRKRHMKISTRRVTTTPPKTGIVYISDSEGSPDNNIADQCSWKSDESKGERVMAEDQKNSPVILMMDIDSMEPEVLISEQASSFNNEAVKSKKRSHSAANESIEVNKMAPTDQLSSAVKESILRTLLLEEPPVESELSSKNIDMQEKNHRDSPEIVEVKVHHQDRPHQTKTTASVVHNLRLEIAALERLAADKEREKRFLLYFKSCKEELLKRLTSDPSPPPCKNDLFSSVKRMSESSSFRPYSEMRQPVPITTDTMNSYKSLMLTTAGQWSTSRDQQPRYGSCGVPLQTTDLLRNKTHMWPSYPTPLPNIKNHQWTKLNAPNLVGHQIGPTRDKPVAALPQCVVCKVVKAAFLCSGCGKEWYCSEQCQRQNWKHHSRMCSS